MWEWPKAAPWEIQTGHLEASLYWDHWNRLPWEMIDTPSLSVFKRHLDCVLNSVFCQPWIWGSCLFFIFYFPPSLEQNSLLLRAVGSGNAAAVGERRRGTRTVLGVDQCGKWEAEQQQHWGCVPLCWAIRTVAVWAPEQLSVPTTGLTISILGLSPLVMV